ncbi:MAG: hypothetical protein ACK5LV_09550 [Lachnospirales bacterium]
MKIKRAVLGIVDFSLMLSSTVFAYTTKSDDIATRTDDYTRKQCHPGDGGSYVVIPPKDSDLF